MTDENTSAPPAEGVGLTLTDIQNTLKVIDYACDQGAFKGWEVINGVHAVRTRLVNFLNAAQAAQSAEAEAAPQESAE